MSHLGDQDLVALAHRWLSRDGSFQGEGQVEASHMRMALKMKPLEGHHQEP